MLNLSNALKNSELSQKEKSSEILKSKFFLYDVCFEKAISFLQTTGINKDESHVFDQVRQGICASFVFMTQLVS